MNDEELKRRVVEILATESPAPVSRVAAEFGLSKKQVLQWRYEFLSVEAEKEDGPQDQIRQWVGPCPVDGKAVLTRSQAYALVANPDRVERHPYPCADGYGWHTSKKTPPPRDRGRVRRLPSDRRPGWRIEDERDR